MSAPATARGALAAALATVETSLAAAENALASGAEIDLGALEDRMRTLCVEATMLDIEGRKAASEILGHVLARLTALEIALGAAHASAPATSAAP